MLIQDDLIRGSAVRWHKRTRQHPDAMALRLGEGDRSACTSARQRQARRDVLLQQAQDPMTADAMLERIIEGNDLVGVNYLSIGTLRARSVCRIHLRDATGRTLGFGTGFLVGPRVLMTNHHVISAAEDARSSLAEFDYEYDENGADKPMVSFALLADPAPIAHQPLDFCLVAVAPRSTDGRHGIDEFGWLPLDPTPGKAIVGEYLTIVQHPAGERKQVCVRENKLLKYDENGTTLWYKTDTAAGSSGSPVFNQAWQVVALHHSGVPDTDKDGHWLTVDGTPWDPSMDETRVKWIANEGIRISSILQFLQAGQAASDLARATLRGAAPPRAAPIERRDGPSSELVGDELRMTIPLRFSVRLDTGLGLHAGIVADRGDSAVAPALPAGPQKLFPVIGGEEIVIDQSNYDERPGYDPTFLGKGKLAIPLPNLKDAGDALLIGAGKNRTSELRYWNYSVRMNKARRIAFISAINVDGNLRKGAREQGGDRWYFDTRIDEKYQLGAEFYGAQRNFEVVDRSKNPFDRGHLSARNDAQWGETPALSKRNGNDSFHWTNCSPQHFLFNQGKKLWEGLEEYVIDGFAKDSGRRASVFNGPVFDAPLSALNGAGRPVPKVKGKPARDPTFGGVSIPKLFFKVVACARDGRLAVAAFLMSQEDLLATDDRIRGLPPLPQERLTQSEAKVFQVSVRDVAALTQLDFGPLIAADTMGEELLAASEPRPVEVFSQIAL